MGGLYGPFRFLRYAIFKSTIMTRKEVIMEDYIFSIEDEEEICVNKKDPWYINVGNFFIMVWNHIALYIVIAKIICKVFFVIVLPRLDHFDKKRKEDPEAFRYWMALVSNTLFEQTNPHIFLNWL